MEVEKKSSKGGFLSLFDWGGKSRKKLFPNNNAGELDGIKKVKENVDGLVSKSRLVEYDENRGSMNYKGNGEFNCASSVSSDDGYRTGAPSVVARLMGLDTMPNVSVNEPCSAQNMDSHSLMNGYLPESSLNCRIEGTKDQKFSYNSDGFLKAPAVMTPQKMPGRPIERFQTEMLPPRSAKTIPITHHKLLSPIKSPGFIPTKNAAYIMEAASRMIDPNPRAAINGRMASHASSSVPLRIRDLKERMEASQKSLRLLNPKESVMRSNVNRREAKTLNGTVDASKMKAPLNSIRSSSDSSRSRGNVGLQREVVKSNIHKREASVSTSGGIKNSTSNRIVNEAVSKQAAKRSQQGIQQRDQPRAVTVRSSSVLRQNNQKQNDTQSGNSSGSNSSVPNQLKKKPVQPNSSLKTNKTVRKIAVDDQSKSNKDLTITDTGRRYPVSKGMNSQQQKKSKNGTNHSDDLISETILVSKDGKSIQCNAVIDGSSSWATGNNKNGMDVISFTFSSPIKKHPSNSEDVVGGIGSCKPSGECSHVSNNAKMSTLSPLRFNRIGPDDLGILLEQKLKELTCRIDSSSDTFKESHETYFQDSVPSTVAKTSSEECNNSSQFCISSENSDSVTEQESNNYDLFLTANKRAQVTEDCCSVNKKNESNMKLDGLNSVSYHDESPSNEGWCSSSENSCSVQETTIFEVNNASESCDQAEYVVDSMEALDRNFAPSYSSLFSPPTSWESLFVRDVIGHVELRVNSYLLGQVGNVINSSLFDRLEAQPSLPKSETLSDKSNKLERRLLFDCISELTNQRCQQLTTGCSKSWSKWAASSYQTDSFSRELYTEISSLKNMEELMVDEVVDKDMSSVKGRWLNFDVEASEECIEMEKLILASLLDEVVADLLI